jgi:hypothetical protein
MPERLDVQSVRRRRIGEHPMAGMDFPSRFANTEVPGAVKAVRNWQYTQPRPPRWSAS